MGRHHPIHGLFAQAFEAAGGFNQLVSWAGENYGEFIRLFVRMAPPPQFDISARQVNIQVNNALKPSPLDRAPLEHE